MRRSALSAPSPGVPTAGARARSFAMIQFSSSLDGSASSGQTCHLCDEEALGRKVETIISDHGSRQRLRARALEEARSRFTLDRYQRDIVGLVTQLGEAT